jgi:hypothetical protein
MALSTEVKDAIIAELDVVNAAFVAKNIEVGEANNTFNSLGNERSLLEVKVNILQGLVQQLVNV